MKSLRQTCVNCNEQLSYKNIDNDKYIYKCSICDTLGSIHEHRVFKPNVGKPKPKNIEIYTIADTLFINIKGNSSVPIRGRMAYLILTCLGLALFTSFACGSCTFNHQPLVQPIIPISLWIILSILIIGTGKYMEKHRKVRIELDPYTLEIGQVIADVKHKHIETKIETYMIDQLYVRKAKIYRDPESNSLKNKKDFYELRLIKKDNSQVTLLPPHPSKESYLFVEHIIENHLDIKNREITEEI